jgi:predicted phage terminase large subunit-like protein
MIETFPASKYSTAIDLTEPRVDGLKRLSKSLISPLYSFPEFIRKAWPILEPANPLMESWYVGYLCEHLELVTRGEIKKLLINMPPRYGKSNIVTILWPVWSWTQKPSMRWIFCSYSSGLSVKHSLARRRVIESQWFQDNWGGLVTIQDDQNQKHEYENTARGHMISTSVGGTLTGKGGDVIVEDDMLKPDEAESEAMRYHMQTMHASVLSSRLDNPKTGIRVVVEQRTHAQDLTGHILKNESGWHHVVLPLVAEGKTVIEFPISKKRIVRNDGDLLNEGRHGQVEVDELKKAMGTRTFAAQGQQNPSSEIGNILKRSWWKFYSVLPSGFDVMITSWDMSFKETKEGSFVVGQLWGKRGADYYLIRQMRERCDFSEALQMVVIMAAQNQGATGHLIEDKANGPAIISVLQKKISGLIPIQPQGSKIARAQAASPIVEAGNVHLPEPNQNPWVNDFIEECAAFKGTDGEINDQVDAMTQAINFFNQARFVDQAELAEEADFAEIGDNSNVGGFLG